MTWLFLVLYLAGAGDVLTTCRALNNGFHEKNPIFGKNPSCKRVAIVKAVALTGVTILLKKNEDKYTKQVKWTLGLSIGFNSVAVTWNIYQLKTNGR